jgi:hypothetical protein
MSGTVLSLLMQYRQDVRADGIQGQVVRLDTGEYIHVRNGSILLRVFIDANPTMVRCLMRHLNSGREVYLQGGPKLLSFVNDCLINDIEAYGCGGMDSAEK